MSPRDDHPARSHVHEFLLGRPRAAARVASVARRVIHSRGSYVLRKDRDDVVQEVVIDVWRAATRPGFDVDQDFDVFVRTVAYRRCVDWRRRHRRAVELGPELPGDADPPDEALLNEEKLRLGRRVLQGLGRSCRELIQLRAVDDLAYQRIAEIQGRTEGAIRNQMYKCLKQARRILGRIRRDGSA